MQIKQTEIKGHANKSSKEVLANESNKEILRKQSNRNVLTNKLSRKVHTNKKINGSISINWSKSID
jgi:hypothetical protein